MPVRPIIHLFLLTGLVVLLLGALGYLISLRYAKGDNYPSYSSLRTDPLGTAALYESLAALPELNVTRNMDKLNLLPADRPATLFMLGVKPYDLTETPGDDFVFLESFVQQGGRVVFALTPRQSAHHKPVTCKSCSPKENKNTQTKNGDHATSSTCPAASHPVNHSDCATSNSQQQTQPSCDDTTSTMFLEEQSISSRWGIRPTYNNQTTNKDAHAQQANVSDPSSNLPAALKWNSTLYFEELKPVWHCIYSSNGNPVVVERSYGQGSIVVFGDAYHLSNEALRNAAQPQLLAWMIGPQTDIIFDESHLGIMVSRGIMSLAFKYHLQGVMAVLALLASLYIWKNMCPLLPAVHMQTQKERAGSVCGRDNQSGLAGLLERNIPAKQLIETCLQEWLHSPVSDRMARRGVEQRAKELIESKTEEKSNPIVLYRELCEIISHRRKSK